MSSTEWFRGLSHIIGDLPIAGRFSVRHAADYMNCTTCGLCLYQLQREATPNLFPVSVRKNTTEVDSFSCNPWRISSYWGTWTCDPPPLLLARL